MIINYLVTTIQEISTCFVPNMFLYFPSTNINPTKVISIKNNVQKENNNNNIKSHIQRKENFEISLVGHINFKPV